LQFVMLIMAICIVVVSCYLDGQDHCFLNMGSYLVGYDILRSYMHSFLHGRYDLTICICYTMHKDKEVNKNIFFLSMCDVKVFLTFTSLNLVLLWQLIYLFCSSIVINTVIVTAGFLHGRYDLTICICYTMQLNFQRLLSGKFTKNE
jgi:hypothetical protein